LGFLTRSIRQQETQRVGRDPVASQPWLDTADRNIGFTRRQALERGMRRLVASTLIGTS
jgi:hypothetical protein